MKKDVLYTIVDSRNISLKYTESRSEQGAWTKIIFATTPSPSIAKLKLQGFRCVKKETKETSHDNQN